MALEILLFEVYNMPIKYKNIKNCTVKKIKVIFTIESNKRKYFTKKKIKMLSLSKFKFK